jgi:hypothetical protein
MGAWQATADTLLKILRPGMHSSSPNISANLLLQSIFFDGLLILNKFTFTWVADRFFYETLGVPYDFLIQTIKRHAGTNLISFSHMEHILSNQACSFLCIENVIEVDGKRLACHTIHQSPLA